MFKDLELIINDFFESVNDVIAQCERRRKLLSESEEGSED